MIPSPHHPFASPFPRRSVPPLFSLDVPLSPVLFLSTPCPSGGEENGSVRGRGKTVPVGQRKRVAGFLHLCYSFFGAHERGDVQQ